MKPATVQDLDTIIEIRSKVHNLKILDADYIQAHIQEFVLAIISEDQAPAGIMRLFSPECTPHTIEMGSFIKVTPALIPGVSTALIQYAEHRAMLEQKPLIAITQSTQNATSTCLAHCLERHGWTNQSHQEIYQNRLTQSLGKELWEKTIQVYKER